MASTFHDDLLRFGPDSELRLTLEEARTYCARLASSHYENFSVVSLLTPKRLRLSFQSIYAFCRWADDLGDEINDRAQSGVLLDWWRKELLALFHGQTQHPVMIALAETVHEFAIPPEPFLALISAFEQDQEVTEYETYSQLLDYCTRSANPVGHLVLYLARAFNPENASLSDCTCTGLQLANFWQDVARDLDIGRIYLPREDRLRFNYPSTELHAKRFNPEFAALLAYEVERAEHLLVEGRRLVDRMPGDLRLTIDLFSRGGLAILDLIKRQNYDVLTRRPRLSRLEKLRLILSAALGRKTASLPEPPALIRSGPG